MKFYLNIVEHLLRYTGNLYIKSLLLTVNHLALTVNFNLST
jgi:hypothetical protein